MASSTDQPGTAGGAHGPRKKTSDVARPDGARAAGAAQGFEPDPGRWRALAICLVGGFMVLLDVSIVNVALPSMRSGLGASPSDLEWVVSGYALTFGLFLVPSGRLGDMRGRRTVFVVGLALFAAASALCGAAQSSLWLVVARLAQGIAGGVVTPQISALIQHLFRGAERGKAFGIFGSVIGISTAIGPLLGGLLIAVFGQDQGWRYVFFVNVPIAIVALPFAWRLLPAPPRGKRHDVDPVGVVLLGAGVACLLLPFVQGRQWHGPLKWLLVVAAAVLLGAFVVWEHRYASRGREPLVDLALYRRRSYSFGSGLITLYFAGFTPLFFVFTLFLQTGLEYSALLAGLATIPFAIGSAITSVIGGRLVPRLGPRLIVLGAAIVAVGLGGTLVAVALAPRHGTGLATIVPLLIAGLGSGLVIAPNQTCTLSQVPVDQAGTAGGLLQTVQRIGSAIGIAAVGSAFFAEVAASHGKDFAAAYRGGIVIAVGFVVAALLVAIAQVVVNRRAH